MFPLNFSRVILALGPCLSSLDHSTEKPSNYACHPCTGVMLIFSERELSVSSLRRGHSKKKSLCPSISIVGKKTFLTRHPCTGRHVILLCIVQRKSTSNCACHPCARAIRAKKKKKLELCVSSLRDDLPKDLPTKCMRSPSLCSCFGKTHRLPAHHLTHHWSIAPASPVPPHPLLAPPQSGRVVSILRQRERSIRAPDHGCHVSSCSDSAPSTDTCCCQRIVEERIPHQPALTNLDCDVAASSWNRCGRQPVSLLPDETIRPQQ